VSDSFDCAIRGVEIEMMAAPTFFEELRVDTNGSGPSFSQRASAAGAHEFSAAL
jgi:hypothetical protein